MYCEKCGNEVKNNINFCPICGQDMKNVKAKNEEAKQKIIKDLSVALPIYKGLADLCDEQTRLEELLNQTYEKKSYGTPLITLLVYFLSGWAKVVVAFLIVSVVTTILPVSALLNLIFANDYMTVALVKTGLQFVLSIVAVVMFRKLKRDNYKKEIAKKEEEIDNYMEQYACEEMYLMPEGYGYYDAVHYAYESLVSGRADTLKEALKLYDRHCQMK